MPSIIARLKPSSWTWGEKLWLALCALVLVGLARDLDFSHVPADQVAKAASAKYRGVCWLQKCGKFQARLSVEGSELYLGLFDCAEQAARAFDQRLRIECLGDKLRLKRSLNFPSKQERAYTQTKDQARKRGPKHNGKNNRKEAKAFDLAEAERFEIRRLSGSSKAHAFICVERLRRQRFTGSAEGSHQSSAGTTLRLPEGGRLQGHVSALRGAGRSPHLGYCWREVTS